MTVGLGLIQMGMQKNVQGLVNGCDVYVLVRSGLLTSKLSFMCMTGVGVGLTAGPNVVQARFLMPDHVAVTNALLLFVSCVDMLYGAHTQMMSCSSAPSVGLSV
jgi:hypothetical protein